MEQLMNKMDTIVGENVKIDNKYIVAGISLLLIMYASYAVPKLHPTLLKLFDSILFKILIMFCVLYINLHYQPSVSLIVAIVVAVLFLVMNMLTKTTENMAPVSGNHLEEVPEYSYMSCDKYPVLMSKEKKQGHVGEHGELMEGCSELVTGVPDDDMKSLCMHLKKDVNATDKIGTSSEFSELLNSKEACEFASHQYKTMIPDVPCSSGFEQHKSPRDPLATVAYLNWE